MEDEPKPLNQPKPTVRTAWHELYLELQSNPLDNRTDIEFCAENKLSNSALTVWKRENRKAIYDEVQKRRGQYINEMRAIGYKHLNRMCQKDINAVKLLFQLTGDLVEQTKTTHEFMSRQDRIDRVKHLMEEALAKARVWDQVKKIQEEPPK